MKFKGEGTHLKIYINDYIKLKLKDLNITNPSSFWTSTLSGNDSVWQFYVNSFKNTIDAQGFLTYASSHVRAVAAF